MVDALDRLPLAALQDELLGGDPSCLYDPVLFTGPDEGHPTQEVLLTALNETKPQASGLPTLSLRRLRDMVVAGDPGCICDPELFTGPAGIEPEDEPAEDRAARIAVAREVCASCPARLACLAYTLRTRPAAGVWAGFIPEEIAALVAAANRPARPRRNTALRPASAEPARIAEVA